MDIWTLFIDLGFISLLLLVGTLARATLRPVQVIFFPASVIAGLLGLLLGPNGLSLIPFSDYISTYPSVLIAIIFAALPFASKFSSFREAISGISRMWAVAESVTLLEWGAGAIFSLVVLNFLFGQLPDGFGYMLATGFVGGYGTAAAMADAFGGTWDGAASLGMTSATVGLIAAILGGIIIVKIESARNNTQFISSFAELPKELRTGLIPSNERQSIGWAPVSGMSIDPLVYHLSILAVITSAAYGVGVGVEHLIPGTTVPTFSVAFILGYCAVFLCRLTGVNKYLDAQSFKTLSNSSTDLLVAFGIASIDPAVVVEYAAPLSLLLLFGIALVLFFYLLIMPRLFDENRVEQSIFTWGWATGTVAMGIALLRIVDPDLKSGALDYYGVAYLPIGFVDVLLVALAPALAIAGYTWWFALTTVLIGLVIAVGGLVMANLRGSSRDVRSKQ